MIKFSVNAPTIPIPFHRLLKIVAFVVIAGCAVALISAMAITRAHRAGSALDRIRDNGRIRFGYRVDARPFSFTASGGQAAGYSVELCQRIAEDVTREFKRIGLEVEWIPLSIDERFRAVQEGRVDVLCG